MLKKKSEQNKQENVCQMTLYCWLSQAAEEKKNNDFMKQMVSFQTKNAHFYFDLNAWLTDVRPIHMVYCLMSISLFIEFYVKIKFKNQD